jgi:hypothetical protein
MFSAFLDPRFHGDDELKLANGSGNNLLKKEG